MRHGSMTTKLSAPWGKDRVAEARVGAGDRQTRWDC